MRHPQKKFYRQRAHTNPIADHSFDYPVSPAHYDWSRFYPNLCAEAEKGSLDCVGKGTQQGSLDRVVRVADIGCGYGGLLVRLSSLLPDYLILGMEIRVKVCDYVQDRIKALREANPGQFNNIACIRSNAMKYLPNFFNKAQLEKMFFLFPDPHFKKTKHKWRIISPTLLSDYAFVLKEGGLLYTMTDVRDLYDWMTSHLDQHPLFEKVSESQLAVDPIVSFLYNSSEEAQKVTRNNGEKLLAVYVRCRDPFLSGNMEV